MVESIERRRRRRIVGKEEVGGDGLVLTGAKCDHLPERRLRGTCLEFLICSSPMPPFFLKLCEVLVNSVHVSHRDVAHVCPPQDKQSMKLGDMLLKMVKLRKRKT